MFTHANPHTFMTDEQPTRFSGQLPNLLAALHLLYVGRLVAGFVATEQCANPAPNLSVLDATIETVTDEIRATELLHEAALLVGDVLPETD
jgi:hypothetical protein